MTLFSLGRRRGRLPRAVLEKIDAAISMVRFPAVDVVLDEAGSFETKAPSVPFVLKGEHLADLEALRLFLRDALLVKGFKVRVHKSFTVHATLAYSPYRAPSMKVEPFRWKAQEFHLIESWVGRTKHVELARWALRNHDAQVAA